MSSKFLISIAALATVSGLAASIAPAAPIFGGPTYDDTVGTGFLNPQLPWAPGGTAGNGTAVGYANKLKDGTNLGTRAVRWDASGTAATELGGLGTSSNGVLNSYAYAVNADGTAVGVAPKYTSGSFCGYRAVRWDASGTAATELGNIGTEASGFTTVSAYAVNAAGTAIGYAIKFTNNTNHGTRAVRWDASGTAATELGNIGTTGSGFTESKAYAINAAGTAVGYANKHTGNTVIGVRAVRWDASGTAATELGNIGTNSSGHTLSRAYAVNASGTAVGFAQKFSGDTSLGDRALRWDASTAAATELGNIGASGTGVTNTYAYAVNASGTTVGVSDKYSGNTSLGTRAVRWDASGTAATELGTLGTNNAGVTNNYAYALNADGTAVGKANIYSGNALIGTRAVAWGLDGVAIDLNTVLNPADASHWTLTEARDISDTGWVTGIGMFDPDGPGGQAPYTRAFLLQLPLTPCRTADFDGNSAVDVADLFAFLDVWFAQFGGPPPAPPAAGADIDGDNLVTVSDLFMYLDLWFEYFNSAC